MLHNFLHYLPHTYTQQSRQGCPKVWVFERRAGWGHGGTATAIRQASAAPVSTMPAKLLNPCSPVVEATSCARRSGKAWRRCPLSHQASVTEVVSVAMGQRMHEATATVVSPRKCAVAEALAATMGDRYCASFSLPGSPDGILNSGRRSRCDFLWDRGPYASSKCLRCGHWPHRGRRPVFFETNQAFLLLSL